MFQRIIRRFQRKINIIYKNYPPCGRIPCQCLLYLDLNKVEEKEQYLSCYETWFRFTELNITKEMKNDK